ncbi:MAG: hypothetical protein RRX92_07690 [Lachnospiraceae bacterium]
MSMRDELKEQRKKTSAMTIKERLQNYWYYHKMHTFIGIVVGIVLVFMIQDFISANKESVFEMALFNTEVATVDEDFIDGFAQKIGMDPKKQDLFFDNSYAISLGDSVAMNPATIASAQKMMAMVQVGDLDAILGLSDVIDYYTKNNFIANLNDFMSPEKLAAYEESDQIYYATLEDGTKMPAGIILQDSEKIEALGLYHTGTPILSFSITATHIDNTLAFLDYIYE